MLSSIIFNLPKKKFLKIILSFFMVSENTNFDLETKVPENFLVGFLRCKKKKTGQKTD